MKKQFLKICVGIVTFGLGFAVSWIYQVNSAFNEAAERVVVSDSPKDIENSVSAFPDGVIAVYFSGFIQSEDGLEAKFDAVNYGTNTVFYEGVPRYKDDKNGRPFPRLKLGEREFNPFLCYLKLKPSEFKPGETVSFTVNGEMLNYYLKISNDIQIGLELTDGKGELKRKIWSDILQIPATAKRQLSKEANERQQKYKTTIMVPIDFKKLIKKEKSDNPKFRKSRIRKTERAE